MRKQLWITFFSLLLTSCLFSKEDAVVYLALYPQQNPLYIVSFQKIDSMLSFEYVHELTMIMKTDFELDGHSHVVSQNSEIDKRFHQNTKNALHQDTLKQLSIKHLIIGKIDKNILKLSLFDAASSTLTNFQDVSLSGDIQKDRNLIHQVSDSIHKRIYGIDGIARTKIIYSYCNANQGGTEQNWLSEIYIMDYDGKQVKQLTKENSYSICPQFFPNKNQFMYVCYKNGQPKIYYSVIGQSKGMPLVDLRGNQLLPAVSKQSDHIAYISDAAGRPDLFVQQFDPDKGVLSKPIQLYSYPQSVQASPTFSPDGRQIAFVSDKDHTPKIYIIDLSTATNSNILPHIQCITTKNKENTSPCWSPDGKKIAYCAKTEGARQIWIYDFEKKAEYQLTFGDGDKENPSFAPNSLHLVYNTTTPKSDIFIINLNDQKPMKITSGEGIKHYPSWEVILK
ncbi:MAG: PD40 domain-containing protein [Chlamydiales bacterium]|nr:PD40 domain-containing protein [Chlamydiales bacterium]